MIDDSLDNALDCARAGIHTLLFGKYAWNRRQSQISTALDKMSFEQRTQYEGGSNNWWLKDDFPDSAFPGILRRVSNWDDVLKSFEDILTL